MTNKEYIKTLGLKKGNLLLGIELKEEDLLLRGFFLNVILNPSEYDVVNKCFNDIKKIYKKAIKRNTSNCQIQFGLNEFDINDDAVYGNCDICMVKSNLQKINGLFVCENCELMKEEADNGKQSNETCE